MDDFNEVDFDNINLELDSNLSDGEDNFVFTQELPSFQNNSKGPLSQDFDLNTSIPKEKSPSRSNGTNSPSSHGLTPSDSQISQGPQNTQGSLASLTIERSQTSYSNVNGEVDYKCKEGISNEISQTDFSNFQWDFDFLQTQTNESANNIGNLSTSQSIPSTYQTVNGLEKHPVSKKLNDSYASSETIEKQSHDSRVGHKDEQENTYPYSNQSKLLNHQENVQAQGKKTQKGKLVLLNSNSANPEGNAHFSHVSKLSKSAANPSSLVKKARLSVSDLAQYKTMKTVNCGPPPGAKLNRKECAKWEYLLHRDFREYQFRIVECCLFFNTIVGLPTGLGKTFIAVNVMYNYYRWFEDGKIFFLAPTKPLVTQQLTACLEIDIFNSSELMELTGETNSEGRKLAYQKGKIFFMTPQTLENDIKNLKIKLDQIVLVIYGIIIQHCILIQIHLGKTDEAHRATKGYAYCEIQKALDRKNTGTRVIALTATPGNDMDHVKEVVRNVRASKMFVKDENDEDVTPYLHNKKIEIMQIPTNDIVNSLETKVNDVVEKLAQIIKKCLHVEESAMMPEKASQICYETVKKASDAFQAKIHHYFQMSGPEMIIRLFEGFSLVYSVLHVRKALIDQGYKSFVRLLKNFATNTSKKNGTPNYLKLEMLKSWPEVRYLTSVIQNSKNSIHPKLIRLGDLLEKYFDNAYRLSESGKKHPTDSRALVFTQSRASAIEIEAYLKFRVEKSKPKVFLGQGDRDATKGMSQREQLMAISQFKKGKINTLVATCVAEEGLDIGEVDLIVCYDSGLTPIRLVQRMGRTGRKRDGKVVLLLMEKEYRQFIETEAQRKRITAQLKTLCDVRLDVGTKITSNELGFYSFNPRMLPDDILPSLQLSYPKKQSHVGSFAVYATNSSVNSTVNCLSIIQQEREKEEKLKLGEVEEEQFDLKDFHLEEFEASLQDYLKDNQSLQRKIQEAQLEYERSEKLKSLEAENRQKTGTESMRVIKQEESDRQMDLFPSEADLQDLKGIDYHFEEPWKHTENQNPCNFDEFSQFPLDTSELNMDGRIETSNTQSHLPNQYGLDGLKPIMTQPIQKPNKAHYSSNQMIEEGKSPFIRKDPASRMENIKQESTEMILEGTDSFKVVQKPQKRPSVNDYFNKTGMKIFQGSNNGHSNGHSHSNGTSFEKKTGIEISMKSEMPPEVNYNIPELEMMASGTFNSLFAERQRGIRKIRAENSHAIVVNSFEIRNDLDF